MTQEHVPQAGAILIAYWKGETPDDVLMFRACGQLAGIALAAMKPRKQSLVQRDPERYRVEIMNLLQRLALDNPGAAELIATLAGIPTPTRQRGVPKAPAIVIQGDYAQINIGNIQTLLRTRYMHPASRLTQQALKKIARRLRIND